MIRLLTSLTIPQKRRVLLAVDTVLVLVAVAGAFGLQYNFTPPDGGYAAQWPLLVLLMLSAAAYSLLLGITRIRLKSYERRAIRKTALLSGLLGVTSLALSALSAAPLPLSFHINFALIYLLASISSRYAMLQTLIFLLRLKDPACRVVIYGAGRTGMQLASALKADPMVQVVAFIDDNPALKGSLVAGLPVYPGLRAEQLITEQKIHRVLLAMPSMPHSKRTEIGRRFEAMGLDVQSLPSFAQLIGEEELVDKLIPVSPNSLLGRERRDSQMLHGADSYEGRCVMISGAGGSIGSELCRQVLSCKPRKLVLFELSELALYTIERELEDRANAIGTEIVPVLGSVGDASLVAQTLGMHGVEIVLHAAAYKHVNLVQKNALSGLRNNVIGTAVLAQQAIEAGVGRFVLISTDKAVRPKNVMGASKRFAELILQDLAMRSNRTVFSIVRFGNVLGSSGSVIPLFQEQLARGGPLTLTDESATRYFMTVQEAAQLVLIAGSFAKGGEVYVLDMGKPIPVRQLARQIIEGSGYTVKDEENPDGDIEIVTIGLRPGEKLHEAQMVSDGDQVTAHSKIFRVREEFLSEIEVAAALKALREALDRGDAPAALHVLSRYVQSGNEDPRELPRTTGA